jgi:hypothetical protein
MRSISKSEKISILRIGNDNINVSFTDDMKMDFNYSYYTNPDADNDNYFNWKHSFLNLDKPGEAGYLTIWNEDIPGNTYYIKNTSHDGIPKFILRKTNIKMSEIKK